MLQVVSPLKGPLFHSMSATTGGSSSSVMVKEKGMEIELHPVPEKSVSKNVPSYEPGLPLEYWAEMDPVPHMKASIQLNSRLLESGYPDHTMVKVPSY